MGGEVIGGHHDSRPRDGEDWSQYETDDWTVFCVVRPPHEVVSSMWNHCKENVREKAHALTKWMDVGPSGAFRLYWRAELCNRVYRYPDVRIPGSTKHIPVVGASGGGTRWREMPQEVLDEIYNQHLHDYLVYGWPRPVR
jgi:hypothetical protein